MSTFRQQIYGLCGYSGSGKSTLAQIIKSVHPNLSVQRISTGDSIRRMMNDRGIEITHSSLQEFNKRIKEKLQEKYISILYGSINQFSDLVVIDALRTMDDFYELKSVYNNTFKLIGVACDKEIRFDRMTLRSRVGDVSDFIEFEEQTKRELQWGAEELLDAADLVICNNLTEDDFSKNYLKAAMRI